MQKIQEEVFLTQVNKAYDPTSRTGSTFQGLEEYVCTQKARKGKGPVLILSARKFVLRICLLLGKETLQYAMKICHFFLFPS